MNTLFKARKKGAREKRIKVGKCDGKRLDFDGEHTMQYSDV